MRHFSLRGGHGAREYQGGVQVTGPGGRGVFLGGGIVVGPTGTSGLFKSDDLAYFNRLNMGCSAQLGP